MSSLLMQRVEPRSRGRAQSISNLAWNVGWAAGAVVGGLLLAPFGGGLFAFGALVGLLGCGLGMRALAR